MTVSPALQSQLVLFFGDLTWTVQCQKTKTQTKPEARRALEKEASIRLTQEVRADLVRRMGSNTPNTPNTSETIVTSASHTWTQQELWTVVVGCSRSVGVDLESSERKVDPGLDSKIRSAKDHPSSLSSLELWVIKEAAFKCNPSNSGTVISQYSVVKWDEQTQTGMVLYPSQSGLVSQSCRFWLGKWDTCYLALAVAL